MSELAVPTMPDPRWSEVFFNRASEVASNKYSNSDGKMLATDLYSSFHPLVRHLLCVSV